MKYPSSYLDLKMDPSFSLLKENPDIKEISRRCNKNLIKLKDEGLQFLEGKISLLFFFFLIFHSFCQFIPVTVIFDYLFLDVFASSTSSFVTYLKRNKRILAYIICSSSADVFLLAPTIKFLDRNNLFLMVAESYDFYTY